MSAYVFFIPGRSYNALEAAIYGSLHRIGFASAVGGFFVLTTWGQIGEKGLAWLPTWGSSRGLQVTVRKKQRSSKRTLLEYTAIPAHNIHVLSQIKHQLDATLCRFYFYRVTLHCFGRKRPSSGVFKTSTAATGTCVIVAGKSSHLLIRAEFRP